MAAALWCIGALLAIVAEVVIGDLTLLMIGGGALVTAGLTFGFGLPYWAQGVVFALTSFALLYTVRPLARRALRARGADARSYLESLPGTVAVVLTPVDAGAGGRVRIGGEEWSARTPYEGVPIDVGVQVTVLEIDGAVAVVVEN
jgi:membrane protein implicated in regulation of membrane protease activity